MPESLQSDERALDKILRYSDRPSYTLNVSSLWNRPSLNQTSALGALLRDLQRLLTSACQKVWATEIDSKVDIKTDRGKKGRVDQGKIKRMSVPEKLNWGTVQKIA